jgi:hypothetical protein
MSAAERSGDPLLAGASTWRLSYMITGRKHPREALDLVMTAVATLHRAMPVPSPERLSVLGAPHLAAATAAAATFDRATTTAWLASARGIVEQTDEANYMGTAFGPVNVAIHAISASLELGDPRAATETSESLDLAAMPIGLVGRRTQVSLDLARAYAMTRKDMRPRSTCCCPPNGSAPSWSVMTTRLRMSSPNCCAASTARRRRSYGPLRIVLA